MTDMYDVIVVGARCAGSPTAMLLARAGHRVLLVDRASFPSDTISSHYIHPAAIARARDWGLLERVTAGCPPIHEVNWGVEGVWFTGSVPHAVAGPAYAPRRTVLDKVLLDAAAEAGADVREGFTVSDVIWQDVRVVGIRGSDGTVERARFVVGADGKRSVVARKVGAVSYDVVPSRAFWMYAYYSGMAPQQQFLYSGDGWGGSLGPTHDGLHLVMAGGRRERMTEFRTDITGNSMKVWQHIAPRVADLVQAATRESRIVGMGDLPGFYRRAWGPGWALAGDAGHHKDPVTAGGISDAWRQADLLAHALRQVLERGVAEEVALHAFEQERNAANSAFYHLTCQLAALEPVRSSQLGLYRALASNRPQADRFTAVMAGTLRPDAFWSDANIGRVLAGEPPASAPRSRGDAPLPPM
jgi:flavin-dependent dehydrogenase